MIPSRTVVRVTRSAWWDGRRLRCETSIGILKTLSYGVNLIKEELSATNDPALLASAITNLHSVEPGIYEAIFNYEGGGEYCELESVTLIPFIQGGKDERRAPR